MREAAVRPATENTMLVLAVIAAVFIVGAEWKLGALTDRRCPPPSAKSVEMLFAPCLAVEDSERYKVAIPPYHPPTILPDEPEDRPNGDATVARSRGDNSDEPSTEGRSQR
jgi:hypothetical protein